MQLEDDNFLAEIDAHITASVAGKGGTWPAFIIRALWAHSNGLHRADVQAAVRADAMRRGKNIPRTFDQTIQQAFERYNAGSSVFRGNPADDIFSFPRGKGEGFWGLNRDRAGAWMRSKGVGL